MVVYQMKDCVLTANLKGFDSRVEFTKQSLPFTFHLFTDKNFPPRFKSMTPRLQARLAKMFGWQLLPGYDYYLWVDGSCTLPHPDSLLWFLLQIGSNDIAVFKHPDRNTVQEEADFLKKRLALEKLGKKQKYVLPRYENEDIDGQLSEVDPEAELYATTAFIYKNSPEVREALKECWYHISRYHTNEQLSFPWCTRNLKVSVIPDKYMKCDYLEFTR
jgi:hypothetical protein